MLVELHIEDLALLERVELPFRPGLNVITGETGAGKSLLIDALELLLGERAKAGLVRRGAERARVEGRFVMAAGDYGQRVHAWLEQHLPQAIEDGAGEGDLELILARSVGADGRSRAHVNHRPVTQRVLRELASQLVEIHGQNDHQRLFDPIEQLQLLDAFGELHEQSAEYRRRRERWRHSQARLAELRGGEDSHLQRLDLLRFQSRELLDAAPSVEERDTLQRERDRLRHADQLMHELGGTTQQLADDDDSALVRLQRAEQALEAWEARLPDLATPASQLRDAIAYTEEAAAAIRRFVETAESDPERLDEVDERLSVLARLERKYRTDLASLESMRAKVEREIAELEEWESDAAALEGRVRAEAVELLTFGRVLAEARRQCAPRLASAVHAGLAELGLERAQFSVEFRDLPLGEDADDPDPDGFGPHGIEEVEFLLAANPGEERASLRRVASGGEMARIMLALRGALAVRHSTPTLIFDEVDSGVGGRLGPRVGTHLRRLSDHHQIFCVTHLPALASEAAHHLRVAKSVTKGRTRTAVQILGPEQRVEEIADMISGGGDQATARAEARRLLGLEGAPSRPRAKRKSRSAGT